MMDQPLRPIQPVSMQNYSQNRDIYSISRLVRETRAILEGSFPLLWVQGEISNLARPASGHLYFSMKDEAAQVRCAMFRMKRQRLRFQPENGQQVLIRARISLYEARGEFQLIAEHMEPAGEGALRLAFEQLKAKLSSEGLFDAAHKRPIPTLPQQIGLITSPSGAAVRDLLSVLGRRFPAIPVVIYPVPVQGAEAPERIVRMLKLANLRNECDLLMLSRGGGSLEDLQAFNDERVARAVHASRIPLITGIGHEIDFTIVDFVADLRAPTPSAAAEHATPDQTAWRTHLRRSLIQLQARLETRLQTDRALVDKLAMRLERQHPRQRLTQRTLRLDEIALRLVRAQTHRLLKLDSRLQTLQARLSHQSPSQRLERLNSRLGVLSANLRRSVNRQSSQQRTRLQQLARDLHNLSPLNTLQRGYAIATRIEDGRILHSAAETGVGDLTEVRLAEGRLICEVKTTHRGSN
ncbi:MAG: exodeoxyribonuclease VII large subunit [Gammaproteobacteria bacterium]|nr:exodeoxyribonuclease VII large subunit [Gammaproteobacteria bacterium]